MFFGLFTEFNKMDSYKGGRDLQVSKHLKDLISGERNFGLTNHRYSTVQLYSLVNISCLRIAINIATISFA